MLLLRVSCTSYPSAWTCRRLWNNMLELQVPTSIDALLKARQNKAGPPSFTCTLLCSALFINLQCLSISCNQLLFHSASSAASSKKNKTFQTSSVSQSGGLFWKSSLVIPRFLCVSSQKPVFRRFSTSPSSASLFQSAPLSCSLVSICSLTSYLPSSRRSLPPSPLRFNSVC